MDTPNRSIKCNVNSCRNHCGSEDYCSLSCITVGTHEMNPTIERLHRLPVFCEEVNFFTKMAKCALWASEKVKLRFAQ